MLRNHSRPYQLFFVVPGGKLSGGDTPLFLFKKQVSAVLFHEHGCFFERLAVTDPYQEIGLLTRVQRAISPDPVEFFIGDKQSRTVQAGMFFPFTHIDNIPDHINGQKRTKVQ